MAFNVDNLKDKLGPLPVWGWGALVAAVVLAYWFIANRGNTEGASTSSSGSNLDATGYHTSGLSGSSGSTVVDNGGQQSNEGWLSNAAARVSAAAGASVSDVRAALYKWLTGQDYTTKERAWIDSAINLVGSPPEGTTGQGNVTPDTPAVVDTQKPTVKQYPTNGTYYITVSSAATKYLFNPQTGKKRAISKAEWGILRATYGDGLIIKTVTAAQLKGIPNG